MHRIVNSLFIGQLILVTTAFAWGQEDNSGKLPVPDAAAIEAADKQVDELFQRKLAAAKQFLDKMRVVDEIDKAAAKAIDDRALQYALLMRRASFSQQISAWRGAFLALEKLEEIFDVDFLSTKVDVIRKWAKATKEFDETPLNTFIHTTVSQAIDADRYDLANELAKVGITELKRFKSPAFRKAMSNLGDHVLACEQEFRSIAGSIEAIKTNAKDPQASLVVGQYRCFVLKNWNAGLPLLAQGSDEVLAKLAAQDLAESKPDVGAAELAEQRKLLADGWYEFSESAEGRAHEQSMRRALYWYRTASFDLTEPAQSTEALERIAELEKGIPLGLFPWGTRMLMSFEKTTWKTSSTGTVLQDLSPHKYHGLAKRGCKVGDGKVGKGLTLDRTGDYVGFKTFPFVSDYSAKSFSLWFNVRQWPFEAQQDIYIFGDIDLDDIGGCTLETSRESAGFRVGGEGKWSSCRTPPWNQKPGTTLSEHTTANICEST